MRFAVSLSLAAIGISFLLPSDGYKAVLFLACAALAFVVMGEEEPELAGHPFAGYPENADEAAYDVSAEDEDSYEREYGADQHFSRH